MVFDILENAYRYVPLHEGFAKAMAFLERPDLMTLPVGRYEIEGDRIFAMVALEPGLKRGNAQLETHEKYIDIQLVLAGVDTMGWKPKALCQLPSAPYDPEADLQLFADEPEAWLPTKSGMFVIFFPEDAHLPLISPGQLHKVVVKIAVAPTEKRSTDGARQEKLPHRKS